MKNGTFTREHYVSVWATILDAYQWWGHDLTTLLDNIKKTNPIAVQAFEMLYNKVEDEYVPQTINRATKFYQKLSKLIPGDDRLYTSLEVESPKRKYKNIQIREKRILKRADYMLAILCFAEEFAFLPMNAPNVSSIKVNRLMAQSDNIVFHVEKDIKTGITRVGIVIPNELTITYCASKNPIE